MIKVLFLWDVAANVQAHFRQALAGWGEPIFPADFAEDHLCALAEDVDVIIGWNPTVKLLETVRQIKLFINPGAGVEHQLKLFRQFSEIPLVNSHGNSYATAQHGFALLLTLMNRIVPHHNWMVEGRWRMGDKDAKSILLRRKTVGVIGYGAVAQWFLRFTAGFELNRIVYKSRPLAETPELVDRIYSGDELHEFLKETDILVVAVPHNAQTENMIGAEELRLLGPEGLLLQIARGPVVNEEALYQALHDRIIDGAAIDVWYEYKPVPDEEGRKRPYHFPFHTLPNVVLSPHRADSPEDDLIRWEDVLVNMRKVYEGKTDFLNRVDLTRGY